MNQTIYPIGIQNFEKDYDSRFGIYKVGFPNLEVEEGFVKYLLLFYTSVSAPKTPFEIRRFVREVE